MSVPSPDSSDSSAPRSTHTNSNRIQWTNIFELMNNSFLSALFFILTLACNFHHSLCGAFFFCAARKSPTQCTDWIKRQWNGNKMHHAYAWWPYERRFFFLLIATQASSAKWPKNISTIFRKLWPFCWTDDLEQWVSDSVWRALAITRG